MNFISGLNKKERIGVVFTLVWILVSAAIAIAEATHTLGFSNRRAYVDIGEFIYSFILYGLLPIIIVWGIYWIKKTPS